MASFDQNLNTLKTATDYPSISTALQDLLDVCPQNQVENFKLKVAGILREKQAAEGRMAKGHPRALQEIDLKYKNLVNLLSSHSPKTQSIVSQEISSMTKPSGLGGLGAMVLKNLFQSKKKLLVGFGVGLGTICGITYIYNKFKGSSIPQKNPDDFKVKKLEGFEKTLAAMQRLRSLNKIGKTGSLEDFEGYLTGGKKKKGEIKEVKKLVDWNKEENALMSSADRALKALANFKLAPPEVPLLSDNSPSTPEIGFDDGKKKRKRREKKEETEISESISEESSIVEEDLPLEANDLTPETEPLPEEPEEFGRLIPVVKRNKRIKKIF